MKENAYAKAAQEYLAKNEITKNGYGYIAIPVSDKVRSEIDRNFLTAFAVKGEDIESGRDTAFIIAKEFRGRDICVAKAHMGLAIGPKGGNISRLVKKLDRRVTFVPDLS